jgi:hypothetical protein
MCCQCWWFFGQTDVAKAKKHPKKIITRITRSSGAFEKITLTNKRNTTIYKRIICKTQFVPDSAMVVSIAILATTYETF